MPSWIVDAKAQIKEIKDQGVWLKLLVWLKIFACCKYILYLIYNKFVIVLSDFEVVSHRTLAYIILYCTQSPIFSYPVQCLIPSFHVYTVPTEWYLYFILYSNWYEISTSYQPSCPWWLERWVNKTNSFSQAFTVHPLVNSAFWWWMTSICLTRCGKNTWRQKHEMELERCFEERLVYVFFFFWGGGWTELLLLLDMW